MVLVNVDDVLYIGHDPEATMKRIQGTFQLKDDKIEKPYMSLGAQIFQKVAGGMECWTTSSEQYVKAAIAIVEANLDKTGQRLPTRCTTPLQSGYRPELDITSELKIDGVRYFQELIGVRSHSAKCWSDWMSNPQMPKPIVKRSNPIHIVIERNVQSFVCPIAATSFHQYQAFQQTYHLTDP
jgi:hypothetical protein